MTRLTRLDSRIPDSQGPVGILSPGHAPGTAPAPVIPEISLNLQSMHNRLHDHPLFNVQVELLDNEQRISLSYQRAKTIVDTYRLTASDIRQGSDKFWAMQMDPVMPQDMACFTILAAHVGLATGTIARYLDQRPDLQPLIESLLCLETVGVYLLSERGHGLDAFNIETTATRTKDGFILNTPREEAAKFMPATTPSGIPKVALVVARLITDGVDLGARTFIVPICTDKEMYSGVESTRLPPRSGTSPLDFSITKFDHVHVPPSALLGDIGSKPTHSRSSWWNEVSRIPIGTLAVACPLAQAIKHVAYIGGKYSFRRKIVGKGNVPVPIISFRTQQWPVLQAVAIGKVLVAWIPDAVRQLQDAALDPRIKHAISVIFKATVCRCFQTCVTQMMERCGAQGTFEHNFMSRIEADARGAIIAEGDVLTLCIRLFSELLLGRYTISLPNNKDALLVQHAASLLETESHIASSLPGGHRGERFNSLMLPQAERVVVSIGHALSYCSGQKAGIPNPLLDIYECAVIRLDPTWYSEHGLSAHDQRMKEDQAVSRALSGLPEYLLELGVEKYVSAPITDDHKWVEWLATLPSYKGNARPELYKDSSKARL